MPRSNRSGRPGAAAGGSTPAQGAVHSCPREGPCPGDFVLNAPCRLIKAGGGEIQISAEELEGFPSGNYNWTTSSAKIELVNARSSTVTVRGAENASAGRDAETITVVRTAPGCGTITKTVNVTVVKVKFSNSSDQRYGYDNYDTPDNLLDDHISVKQQDHTFVKIIIEGGAVGTDFNFVCDDPTLCVPDPPTGAATFDLKLDTNTGFIGPRRAKEQTDLHAKINCPAETSFGQISIDLYTEKEVDVVVAKVFDRTKAATTLRFPNENYASFTQTANSKLKEAVTKFNITNFTRDNSTSNVRYDLNGDGVFTYDIANSGGRELRAISSVMSGPGIGTKTRVAIVRAMKSYYYLGRRAARGSSTIIINTTSNFFESGDVAPLGRGATLENVTVDSISGSTITLRNPLTKNHTIGEPMEFPAAGWSSDPIIIIEGSSSVNTLKWTIVHEVGHRDLRLKDVEDTTNVMHYMQGGTDNRLRYCPRNIKYPPHGTENQWETIPR